MRRFLAALLAVGASTVVTATPAGAQEIPDVPPLGFEIAPLEGPVASVVSGEVDAADVAEHCITDPVDFVAQFVDPEDPFSGGTPYFEAVEDFGLEQGFSELSPEEFATNPQAFAWAVAGFFPFGLALDLPANGGTGELVDGAISQTFVVAFADLATVSPIEPLGNFDPDTGVGQVEVPVLEAGSHPVIATCVGLPQEISVDDVAGAVAAGAAFVEANLTTPFPVDPFSPEFAEVAAQVAPVILQELVEPRALGFQFFCVFDDAGVCPGGEPGPGPGPGGPGPGAPPTAGPATPVTGVQPNFTG